MSEWRANAIGRGAGNLREFLEKKWEADMSKDQTIRVSIETLLEVVENSENIEICVIQDGSISMLDEELQARICEEIQKEKQEAEEAKKKKKD